MKNVSFRSLIAVTAVAALLAFGVTPANAYQSAPAPLVSGSKLYTLDYTAPSYEQLHQLNPATAAGTTIGSNNKHGNTAGNYVGPSAWDASTSTAYIIFSAENTVGTLNTVDLATGVITAVHNLATTDTTGLVLSMAIGTDGSAYVITQDNNYNNFVYGLNLSNGALTFKGQMGYPSGAGGYDVGFAVDPSTGFFWVWDSDSGQRTLSKVNVTDASVSTVRTFTGMSSDGVVAVQFDSNGTLWMLTQDGTFNGTLWSALAGATSAVGSGEMMQGDNLIPTFSLLLKPAVAVTSVAPVFTANTPAAAAKVGTAYSYTYAASGTPAPTFSLASGAFPPGVTLNTTTGVLAGNPTGTGGVYTFTVKASNTVTPDAAGTSATVTVAAAPVMVNDSPPLTATNGTAYAGYTFTASGYSATKTPHTAMTFSHTGTIPAGLSLDPATGLLSGTTTGSAGASTFQIVASNGQTPDATGVSHTITVTVPVAPAFTADSPAATATVNVPYTYTFTASGTPAPTFAITGTALPAEWSLSPAGVLTGTATTVYVNPISVTVVASNGYGTAATSATHTITIQPAPAAPTFTADSPTLTATSGTAYSSYQFAAVGYPTAMTFTNTGTLPPGLTLVGGLLAGTPTGTGGTYTFAVIANNTVSPNKTGTSHTITVSAAPLFTADAPTHDTATVGSAYTPYMFTASGYPAPQFTVNSGSLPTGMSIDATSGALSGTPTGTGGTFTYTVKASNSVGTAAVGASHTITVSATPLFTADDPGLAATVGSAYLDYTFTASGTPAPTFTATGLPAGLSVNSTTGVLSGTPTVGDTAGNYPFTVTASNSVGTAAVSHSHTLVLHVPVAPALVLDSPPAAATVGTAYSYTFTATGYPVPTFTSTNLPAGWVLSSAGVLSAMPTTQMVYGDPITFTVTASNGVSPTSVGISHTITVSPAPAAPVFSSDSPSATGTVGSAYSYQFQASGYPVPTFTVNNADLPPGLSLVNGRLAGTPTGTGGVYTFTVHSGNSVNTDVAGTEHTVTINAAPLFTAQSPTLTATVGSAITGYQFAASGYPTAMTFTKTSGTIPDGLTFTNGLLSGTPTGVGGSFTFTVGASNSVSPSATSVTETIVVDAAPLFSAQTPTPTATVGTVYTGYQFAASGYPTAMTFAKVSGNLPPGLTLVGGLLSGTPTGTGGSYTFAVSAGNTVGAGATSVSETIVVDAAPVFTAQSPTLTATVATAYPSYQFEASGYPTAMTYSQATGTLPPGMAISGSGVLSGTPTGVGGSFTFTIAASNTVDPAGSSVSLTMVVDAAPLLTGDSPTSTATVGTAYSYTYVATGFPAARFTVTSGVLPAGLVLSPAGVISGTPTGTGGESSAFTVTATNGIGDHAVGSSHTITVKAAPIFTADAPPTPAVGIAYSYTFAATGYPARTFAVSSGALPAGLTLTTKGVLSGVATTPGSSTFTVTASNEVNPAAVGEAHTMVVAVPTLALELGFKVGASLSGATTTATAVGLLVGSQWDVQVFSTPQTIGSDFVGLSGAVDAQITLPTDLPAGVHHLLFSGVSASGVPMTATVWFTISATGTFLAISTAGPTKTIAELAATGSTINIELTSSIAVLIVLAGIVLLIAGRRRRSLSTTVGRTTR